MPKAVLIMFRETGERRDFPLNAEKTVVGRKNNCDIRIPLTEVSRQHAEFRLRGADLHLKDLGSANGTFVNNKRIKETKLAPGDRVIIGPVVFTVQLDGQPVDVKPVKTKLRRRRAAAPGDGQKPGAPPAATAADDALVSADELDPISALEALASSADQTAIDPLDEENMP
jgi:pSer/pThr/pTyr-binding forkhead associated (FHA) protein